MSLFGSECVPHEGLSSEINPERQLDGFISLLVREGMSEDGLKVVLPFLNQLQPKGKLSSFGPIADRQHQERVPGDLRAKDGQIPGCATIGCGGKCCDVKPGNQNMIAMSEVEWDAAREAARNGGPRVDHLSSVGTKEIRHRVLLACSNGVDACTGCGPSVGVPSGYEPEDCSDYPYFVNVNSIGAGVEISIATRGNNGEAVKCPLPVDEALLHLPFVVTSAVKRIRGSLGRLLGTMDVIGDMVGYAPLDLSPFLNLSDDDVSKMILAASKFSISRTIAIALNAEGVSSREDLKPATQDKILWAEAATIRKRDQALSLIEDFLAYLRENLTCPKPLSFNETGLELLL